MSKTIEIDNVGPVTHASIPIPEEGGVVVLSGNNGVGKTECLHAVERLTGAKVPLTSRDGTASGKVVGCGMRITVGRSVRRSGELEVVSLEDRLSITDLVEPPIKDPGAADAARIKALLRIADAESDPELFHDVFGGEDKFKEVVGYETMESDDLVEFANKLKRDVEKKARAAEEAAKKHADNAKALNGAIEDVDFTKPHDVDELSEQLANAVKAHERLKTEQHSAKQQELLRIGAQARLDKAQSVTSEAIEKKRLEVHAVWNEIIDIGESIKETEEQLRVLRSKQESKEVEHKQSKEVMESMIAQHAEIEELAKVANRVIESPTDEEIEAAKQHEDDCMKATTEAIAIRGAMTKRDERDSELASENWHKRDAEHYRELARAIESVLSEQVAVVAEELFVDGGRLCTMTKRRGQTLFHELSAGERWSIALDIAIRVVGKHGLIPLKQEAWESLDVSNRDIIIKKTTGTGVVVVTAEATNDPNESGELVAKVLTV